MIAPCLSSRVTAILSGRFILFRGLLARPVDASSLGAFRLLFGALMVWEVIRYFQRDFVGRYYIEPTFYFTYELFPFVAPLPGNWMYALFGVMGLLAVGITLGLFYRLSTALFFLTYTYVFLLDKAPYNNHYYLISLISFLLFFADAHHWASLDKIRRIKPDTVAFWQIFLLRAQLVIVYFFGGIAKLNSDWLFGEPMRMWLANRADYPLVGPLFTTEGAVFFFTYGGLLFDLSIGFLLLWPPTRLLAFLILLFFHLTNNWLFSIGVFPFLGIAATILFVEPAWPRRMLQRLASFIPGLSFRSALNTGQATPLNAWTCGFVILYLALQVVIPLRHWLYPGQVSWTEEGHRFSWRMKLRDKAGLLEFYITDPETERIWMVDLHEDLTARQRSKVSTRPDMMVQYAHYLRDKWQQAGIARPIITANTWVSLNGRPHQPLIDPTVNLAEVTLDPFAPADWILPSEESLAYDPSPVLYLLTVAATVLLNAGLALSCFLVVAYGRRLKHSPGGLNSCSGSMTEQELLPVAQIPAVELIKVVSTVLPYLLTLLSLATWIMTGNPNWLIIGFFSIVLAVVRGFYPAPRLTSRPIRSRTLGLTFALLNLLTGLCLLMIAIIAP